MSIITAYPAVQLLCYVLLYASLDALLLALFPLFGAGVYARLLAEDLGFLHMNDVTLATSQTTWKFVALCNIVTFGVFSPIISLVYIRQRKQAIPEFDEETLIEEQTNV